MNEEHLRRLQTDFGSPDYSACVPHIGNHSGGFLHNLSEIKLSGAQMEI